MPSTKKWQQKEAPHHPPRRTGVGVLLCAASMLRTFEEARNSDRASNRGHCLRNGMRHRQQVPVVSMRRKETPFFSGILAPEGIQPLSRSGRAECAAQPVAESPDSSRQLAALLCDERCEIELEHHLPEAEELDAEPAQVPEF